MKIFSKDALKFREARIVHNNKGAGVGVMGVLGAHDGMRIEDMGNLLVMKDWRNLWWGRIG